MIAIASALLLLLILSLALFLLKKASFKVQKKSSLKISSKESNSSAMPLDDVFYKFSHNSIRDWMRWIKSKGQDEQERAFESLVAYLEKKPASLGMVTNEVIKAIAQFKHEDSLNVLLDFMRTLRINFQRVKHLENFFGSTAKGILFLSKQRAFRILSDEICEIKSCADSATAQERLFEVIIETEYKPEFQEFIIDMIFDDEIVFSAKKLLFRKIHSLKDPQKNEMIQMIMMFFWENIHAVLSDDDLKVLLHIRKDIKGFIKSGYKGWIDTLMKALAHKKTKNLFLDLVLECIVDKSVPLSDRDIESFLRQKDPTKSKLLSALSKRFLLPEALQSIFSMQISQKDLYFSKSNIVFEKLKTVNKVPQSLIKVYSKLVDGIDKKHESKSLKIFGGFGQNEKIFLMRSYASHRNLSFVYIDTEELIKDNQAMSNFKRSLESYSNSVIMLDNFNSFFDTSGEVCTKTKFLLDAFSELSSIKDAKMIISVNIHENEFVDNSESFTKVNELMSHRGRYSVLASLDEPSNKFKQEVFEQYLAITPMEYQESFNSDEFINFMIEKTRDFSYLEFESWLLNYFAYSFFVKGSLVNASDYNKVFRDFPSLKINKDYFENEAEAEEELSSGLSLNLEELDYNELDQARDKAQLEDFDVEMIENEVDIATESSG